MKEPIKLLSAIALLLAIGIAANTPAVPREVRNASRYATGIWKSQYPKIFTTVGVNVSPAPLNDCTITIPYAYARFP